MGYKINEKDLSDNQMFTKNRKLLFLAIQEYVKKNPNILMEKLLAEIQIDFGTSETKAKQMLKTLINADKVVVNNGLVRLNEVKN